MDDLLTVEEAIAILDATPVMPRVQTVPLSQCLNFRLAEDIFADRDYPPFNKSVMDGYAVRSRDTIAAMTLELIETIAAGAMGARVVGLNQAAAIMTGAPIPAGADAVIAVEDTSREGKLITTRNGARVGQNIALKGSDIAGNTLVLCRGTKLTAAPIAVAASVGAGRVSVYGRPRVAVLSTGDELVEIDRTPEGSEIRNSNGHMMVALLEQLGCEVKLLPIARDDPALLREAIEVGLESEALFITGGMSMGERDYIPRLLAEMKLEIRISKLRMKPGKPFVFATGGLPDRMRYVFGLPGNPVSAFVCTVRLAARLISRMSGGVAEPVLIRAGILEGLAANGNREFYLPGYFDGAAIRPLRWKGSADIFTLARANVLVIRPANGGAVEVGDFVVALLI